MNCIGLLSFLFGLIQVFQYKVVTEGTSTYQPSIASAGDLIPTQAPDTTLLTSTEVLTTNGPPTTTEIATTTVALAAPTNVTAVNVTKSSVQLQWSNGSNTHIDAVSIFYYDNDTRAQYTNKTLDGHADSCNVPELASGHTFCFIVQFTSYGNSVNSSAICPRTTPDIPGGCLASQWSVNSVKLNWTSADGAAKYEVSEIFNISTTNGDAKSPYDVNNLSPGQQYSFRVRPFGAPDNNKFGSYVNCSVRTTAPDLPIINQTENVTSSTVIVRWSAGATKTIHNTSLLCKDTNDTSFSQVQYMSDVTSRSFNVSNLQPGHNYSFRVTVWSYDKSSNSTDVYQLTTPKITGSCSTSNWTMSSVSINWNISDGTVSYEVSDIGGNFNTSNTLANNYVPSLFPGVKYSFRVRPLGKPNNNMFGDFVDCNVGSTLPEIPTIVNVFVNGSDTMTLSWSVGSTRTIDSISIQSNDTIANNQSTINVNISQNTRQQSISNLVPGKRYCFNVTVASFGKTNTSPPVCSNTLPVAPSNVTFTEVTKSSIQLQWSNGSNFYIDSVSIFYNDNDSSAQFTNIPLDGHTVSYIASGLASGHNFCFIVQFTSYGNRVNSSANCRRTIPSIPGLCSTSNWATTNATLAWPASDGTQSYEVSDTGNAINKTVLTNTTVVSSLSVGQLYSFRIRPLGWNNLYGEYINCTSDSTPPDTPINLLINETTQSSINTQWSTGATVNIHRISVIYYDQNVSQTKFNSSWNASSPTTPTSRSFNAIVLLSGHVYCFTVEVQSYNKTSTSSALCNRTTPAIPGSCSASSWTTTNVTLNWTSSDGTAKYEVSDYNKRFTTDGNVTTIPYLAINLKPGQQYSFRVRPFGSPDNNQFGSYVNCSVGSSAPERPTIINVSADGSFSISLSWSVGSTQTVDSTYILSNDTIANNLNWINVSNPQTTQLTISNLVPGKQYCFNVTVSSFGKADTSSSVCSSTLPVAPTNVTSTEVTKSSVQLQWSNGSNFHIDSVSIFYYDNDTRAQSAISYIDGHAVSYVSGLASGHNFCFIVQFTSYGNRVNSSAICRRTTPDISGSCSAYSWTTTNVTLNWTSADGTARYEVSDYNNLFTTDVNVVNSPFTAKNLAPGQQYSFCVRPFGSPDNNQFGSYVNCSIGSTAPVDPSNLSISETTQSSINTQWSTGATVKIHRISVIYYDQNVSQTKFNSSGNVSSPTTPTSRSYNATGLLSGHVYCFTVEVQSYNKTSTSSAICNRTTPAIPGSCLAYNWTTTNVTLNWPSAEGTARYEVSDYNNLFTTDGNVLNSTYLAINLTPGQQYSFRVRPFGAPDNNKFGSYVNCSVGSTAPDVATILSISEVTDIAMKLTWSIGSTQNFNSITILCRDATTSGNCTSSNSIATPRMNPYSDTVRNLIPGHQICLKVQVISYDKTSVSSESCSTTTVSNCNASIWTTNNVSLSWPSSAGASSYVIYETNSGINTTTSNNYIIIPNLNPGQQYSFHVLPVGSVSPAVANCTVSNTLPVAPSIVRYNQVTKSSIQLQWSTGSNSHIDAVSIFYNDSESGAQFPTIALNGSYVSYTVSGLESGRNICFIVQILSYDNKINSSASYQRTIPSISGPCSTDTWTTTSAALAWPASYGTQSYEVSDTSNVVYRNSTTNTTVVTSLSVGQLYSFRIRPLGLDNVYGEYVNCAADSTLPDTASNLIINETTKSSINTQWSTGATVNIHRISVVYYEQNDISTKYNSSANSLIATTQRSYNATGLLSGHVYCFTVEVQSYNKTSISSEFCNRTIPSIPGACSTSTWTTTSATLVWPASYGTQSYEVSDTGNVVYKNDTTFSTVVSSLSVGQLYSFRIRPLGLNNLYGEYVNCAADSTPPDQPSIVRIDNVTTSSVIVYWSTGRTNIINLTSVNYYGNETSAVTQNISSVGNRSYNVPSLAPGHYYCFNVSVQSYDKTSQSTYVCQRTTPNITGICNATNWTTNSVSIDWQQSYGTATYEVSDSLGGFNTTNTTNDYFIASSLTPGRRYSFSVRPFGSQNNYMFGASVTCTNGSTPPEQPIIVRIDNVTTSSVIVYWSTGSTNTIDLISVNYYGNETSNVTKPMSGNQTGSYNVSSLLPGHYYCFSVSVQSYNKTSQSKELCQRTTPNIQGTCNTTNWRTNNVSIDWPSSYGTATYELSASSGNFATINTTNDYFSSTSLSPGQKYSFRVRPFGSQSNNMFGDFVACTSGTTNPWMKGNVNATSWTNSSVNLAWTAAISNRSVSYNYTYYYSYNSMQVNNTNQSNATSVSVPDLHPGASYTFVVSAFLQDDTSVISLDSFTCTGTAWPNPPIELTATPLNQTLLIVNWKPDSRSFQDSYTVFIDQIGDQSGPSIVAGCNRTYVTSCIVTTTAGHNYSISVLSFSGDVGSSSNTSVFITSYPDPPAYATNNSFDSRSINVTIFQNSSNSGNIDDYLITVTCPACELRDFGNDPPKMRLPTNEKVYKTSDQTTYYLPDIKPYRIYKFTILSEFNSLRSLTPLEFYESTDEDTPEEVQLVKYDNTSTNGILILSWYTPTEPNGVITNYTIVISNGSSKAYDGKISYDNSSRIKTVTTLSVQFNLKAGYIYDAAIYASTKKGLGTEYVIKRIEMPYAAPVLNSSVPPTITTLTDHSLSFNQLKIGIFNPFSSITGDIANYSIVVTPSVDNTPNKSIPVYSEAAGTSNPFIAKTSSIFKSNRRKRSVGDFSSLCDNPASFSGSCDATITHLQADTVYYMYILACNEYACTAGPTSQGKTDKNWPLITAICCAVIIPILVIIIAIIVIVVICKRRPRNKKVQGGGPGTQETDNRKSVRKSIAPSIAGATVASKPVLIKDFIAHVEELSRNSGMLYTDEYEELKPVGKDQSLDNSEMVCNRTKNRFGNIKPYDVTRVKLLPIEDEEGSDYINANWMPGFNSKREFIATQGPLPATKDDFWRMIWEYNCRGIVMLCNCVEKGRNKCDYYWPQDSEPVVYGDLQVVITEERLNNKWNVRTLEVSMGQQKRRVKHFHYHIWPDMEAPQIDDLIEFNRIVRGNIAQRGGPIVVHCSAGVGRTGTFIALDTLLLQLDQQDYLDVFGVVYRLRMNRNMMVQTESQYVFLHASLAQEIASRNSADKPNMHVTEEVTVGNFYSVQ